MIETALRAGRSHYAALGLSPSATEEQIRKEYIRVRRLRLFIWGSNGCLAVEVDTSRQVRTSQGQGGLSEYASIASTSTSDASLVISHAYRTLSESSSRSRYDSTGDSPPRTGAEETLSRLLDAVRFTSTIPPFLPPHFTDPERLYGRPL